MPDFGSCRTRLSIQRHDRLRRSAGFTFARSRFRGRGGPAGLLYSSRAAARRLAAADDFPGPVQPVTWREPRALSPLRSCGRGLDPVLASSGFPFADVGFLPLDPAPAPRSVVDLPLGLCPAGSTGPRAASPLSICATGPAFSFFELLLAAARRVAAAAVGRRRARAVRGRECASAVRTSWTHLRHAPRRSRSAHSPRSALSSCSLWRFPAIDAFAFSLVPSPSTHSQLAPALCGAAFNRPAASAHAPPRFLRTNPATGEIILGPGAAPADDPAPPDVVVGGHLISRETSGPGRTSTAQRRQSPSGDRSGRHARQAGNVAPNADRSHLTGQGGGPSHARWPGAALPAGRPAQHGLVRLCPT